MNIPDAAVEAAARAQFEWSGDESWDDYTDHDHDMRSKWRHETRAGLRAAAPHIAAQVASDIHGQFGVNVSDEMSDWWDGYRQAQRDVLRKLREIEACYRIEADHG